MVGGCSMERFVYRVETLDLAIVKARMERIG